MSVVREPAGWQNMLSAKDFRVATLQVSVYTPGLHFQSGKLLVYLITRWGNEFDGEPITLPVPSDAPAEIPHVVLKSEDSRLALQIAPARMDLFWRRRNADEQFSLPEYLGWAIEVIAGYLEATSARVGRLACVATRVAFHQAPAKMLVEHFCQPKWISTGPLNRPANFELHAHKEFRLGGTFDINSWVRCKTGSVASAADATNRKKPAVIVEQDFNTLTQETQEREYSLDEIRRFFRLVPHELQTVLDLYFPSGVTNA
jgi:hypothetical protein